MSCRRTWRARWMRCCRVNASPIAVACCRHACTRRTAPKYVILRSTMWYSTAWIPVACWTSKRASAAATSTRTAAMAWWWPPPRVPLPMHSPAVARSSIRVSRLVVAPICPHTLSDRPILVPGDSTVEISLIGHQDSVAQVTCDASVLGELRPGGRLQIAPSERAVTLLHPPGYDFFRLLRSKLHWGRGGLSHER